MVAFPKSNTSEELKPLKTKSMAHVELKKRRIIRSGARGCACFSLCLIMFFSMKKHRLVS